MDARAQQQRHWDAVAGGWATWYDWTARNFQPIADWCRDLGAWTPGVRVLDVGCGAGFPALAAAASVRPGGTVVATDISREMLNVASQRANTHGLDNIRFVEMDAEHLEFEEAAFDAVTNAYGLMFCSDIRRALREAGRVLKPGGRLALVTWETPSNSPFFSVIFQAAAPFLSLGPPDPAAPGPFRLSSPAQLESLLREAGFSDIRVASLPMIFEFASSAEYLQIFSDVAWKPRVAALSETVLAQLGKAVADAARPYMIDGRLELRAGSLCASGRR